jgi:PAS domain S-box-containing protein
MDSPAIRENQADASATRNRVPTLAVIFAAAIALLAAISVFSYRSAQRSQGDARESRRRQELIAEIREVRALLADAEAGQRGFALTADDRFLEPYHQLRAMLPGELARLRSLTADDQHQQRRLDRLEVLQGENLRYVAQTIEMRRSQGLEAVARRIGLRQGKDLMDEAGAVLAEMAREEMRLDTEGDRRAETDAAAQSRALLSLSATGLALLGLAFFALARDNAGRARGEQDLHRLNVQLEERVRERTAQVEAVNQELTRDIAERDRLEVALRASELRIRATLDSMLEGCQIIGFDWRYLYINDVAAGQARRPREALIGRPMMETYPGIENSEMFAVLRHCMEQRVPRRMENRFALPDGSTSWSELSIEPVPEGIFILSVDITERKSADERRELTLREMRGSEARYRRLVENIGEIVFAGGLEGPPMARKLTFLSPQVEAVAGRPPQDFLADPGLWKRLLHPEDVANVAMETERALTTGESVVRFYRLRNEKTDEYRWIEDTFVPDHGDDGAMRGFFVTARDITERWRAEAEAERLRHRNELLLNCAGEGIYGLDLEGRVTFINPKGASLLGYGVDELISVPMHATCHHTRADGRPFPREECPIYAAFKDGRVHVIDDDVMWRKDGGAVPVDCVSTPLRDERAVLSGAVVVFRDITNRRRLEEMVRQSQKLEAIGRLAGGVAHDFNNILGVITGYGELMRLQIEAKHPARPRLEQILKAAERAAGLTRQLLAFSRKEVTQPRILDLSVLVAELDKMLRRVIGEDVELEVRQAPDLGAVKADPTQLEQVILNLVVNARHAMPKGGHLTIETANADLDEAYASSHPPAHAGRYVMLAVSDTGIGMDAETQGRIFEPFFTTKPPGEGTGLGLATVYGVVKQSGGYIWVYSEPGRGTTFKVYLPRVEAQPEALDASTAPAPVPRGRETVLLVEDTESLREMICEALEEKGYSLLPASHGEEALALAREHKGPIPLLLTDLVMPKLGGVDLARQLASLRPEIRVLYMSGYTDGAIARQGVLREGSALLEKPFTTDRLARAVREVLDAPIRRG